MSAIWYGRCEGCFEVRDVVTIKLGSLYQPALCAECEARLRLIGGDYDRLRYTIGQLVKKVPLECLTGDLTDKAVGEVTKVILFARSTWKKDLALKAASEKSANGVRLSMAEPFIPNDLMQRIRTKLANPNSLAPDYSTYNVRPDDQLALHGLGVSWDKGVILPTAAELSEDECEAWKDSLGKLSQSTTPKLFGK